MTSFTNRQYAPPSDWQEFERLCHSLWMAIWEDDGASMNGRRGQQQHGVDVYGRKYGKGQYEGIQCKGKDIGYGSSVTEAELRSEIEKAKTFRPKIQRFILATTAQSDAEIQEVARCITEEHESAGLFSVEVLGWGEIQQRLAQHPKVIEAFYPDQGPIAHKLLEALNVINDGIKGSSEEHSNSLKEITGVLKNSILGPVQDERSSGGVDAVFNDEIDRCKTLIKEHKPETANQLLLEMKNRYWGQFSNWLRFRVLTNIGAAQLHMGNLHEAARSFQEAHSYEPEEKIAACNLVVSYSLLGQHEEAKEAAIKAAKQHPYFVQAHALVIGTSCRNSEDIEPESLVTEDMLDSAEVSYAVGNVYLLRNDHARAKHWMEKAYSINPELFEIRTGVAEAILSGYFVNQAVTFGSQISIEQRDEVLRAIELERGWWDEVKRTEEAPRFEYCAINVCNAYRVLEDMTNAQLVLDEALRTIESPTPALIYQKALLALLNNEFDVVVDTVDDKLRSSYKDTGLMLAQALIATKKYNEAYALLNQIIDEGDNQISFRAKLIIPHVISEMKSHEDAINIAIEYATGENKIQLSLLVSNLALEIQDRELAKKWVENAKALMNEDATYLDRMMLADALYGLGLFSEAAVQYQGLINNETDSDLLRKYLVSLVEGGQRRLAIEELAALPEDISNLPYYCQLSAKLYEMVGDLQSAKTCLENYLEQVPGDLNIRTYWLNILDRLGSYTVDIESFLDAYVPDLNCDPVVLIRYARFLGKYGKKKEAISLAYKIRRAHFELPDAHVCLISLMLIDNGVTPSVSTPLEIDENSAFTVVDANNNRHTFIIERECPADVSKNEIPIDHPIARMALGKRIGDAIDIASSKYSEDKRSIVEIMHKYAYAFNTSMGRFNDLFPNDKRLSRVQIGDLEGDTNTALKPIISMVSDRGDFVKSLVDYYINQKVPISLIAKMSGTHPFDMWDGLASDKDVPITCCVGMLDERVSALNIIKSNESGYVIDPITLYSLYQMNMHDNLIQTCGSIYVTQSSLDLISELIEDRKAHLSGYKTLVKDGDNVAWQEITPDAVRKSIDYLTAFQSWTKINCKMLTAIGNEDELSQWKSVSDMLPSSIIDSLLAANGHNIAILTDDIGFRVIASQMGIDSVWSQPIFMVALDKGYITQEEYTSAIVHQIRINYQFISINIMDIYEMSSRCEWLPSEDFKSMIATLGGKNSDIESSLGVAGKFIAMYWNSDNPIDKKYSFTFAILNGLTYESYKNVKYIIMYLYTLQLRNLNKEYRHALVEWCKWHFISFE